MEKVLLTGGNGFFCSRMKAYYRNKYDICALGKQDLNITDAEAVERKVDLIRPDIIIHAGAVAKTEFCENNSELARKINVEGSVNVARAAEKYKSKMVFISSEQVFNGNKNCGPFKEEDEAVPNTVYGANKLEAEGLLNNILDELWIVRFTWMFGLPERGTSMSNGILWDTISKLLRKEIIIASKREFRGMGYIFETVKNMEKLFSAPFGTYHMGAENNCSRYEIVEHIIRLMGMENQIEEILKEDTQKYQDKNRDVRLDISKACAVGMSWTETKDALELCLKEFGII